MVDGVFAIATTLLVLEIRVPEAKPGQLAHELGTLGYAFGAYAVGFLQTFGGWSVSHRLSARLKCIDQWTVLVLGVGLAFVTLIPFSTAALAESLEDPGDFRTAMALVTGLGFFSTLTVVVATLHAWHARMFIETFTQDHFRWLSRLMVAATVGFGVAFGLSFLNAWLALVPVVVGYAATLFPLHMDEFPVSMAG
ncbi:MAG TPA: TMEM175 family protein [Acidimicrobiales bacterium]|nr:TMEM175 family protein [Acidimicrobiales bacterium]